MEARLLRLRDTAAEEARCTAAARRTAELRAAREARRSDHARVKRDLIDAVMEAVSRCASHREMVQSRLGELKGSFGLRLQQLLTGDAGANQVPASVLRSADRSRQHGLDDSRRSQHPASAARSAVKLFSEPEEEDDEGGVELELQLQPGEEEDEEEQGRAFTGRPSMRPVTLENIMLDLSN